MRLLTSGLFYNLLELLFKKVHSSAVFLTNASYALNASFANLAAFCVGIANFRTYSGHADQEQLVNYVVWIWKDDYDPTGQTTVFLNHGTDEARRALKEAIEEKDRTQNRGKPISVRLPEINQWYNLNKDGEREESGQDVVEETDSTLISEDTMITVSFSPGDIHISLPVKYEDKLTEISRFFRKRILSSGTGKESLDYIDSEF